MEIKLRRDAPMRARLVELVRMHGYSNLADRMAAAETMQELSKLQNKYDSMKQAREYCDMCYRCQSATGNVKIVGISHRDSCCWCGRKDWCNAVQAIAPKCPHKSKTNKPV